VEEYEAGIPYWPHSPSFFVVALVWWIFYLYRAAGTPPNTPVPVLMGWSPTDISCLNTLIDIGIVILMPGIIIETLIVIADGAIIAIICFFLEAMRLINFH